MQKFVSAKWPKIELVYATVLSHFHELLHVTLRFDAGHFQCVKKYRMQI